MNALLFEFIAFIISVLAFLYGLFKIYKVEMPLYFKLIITAVGCYAMEELWTIVNAICNFENDFFSVRLIGIFGCFCTLLTANINEYNKITTLKNNLQKIIPFIAPIITIVLFIIYVLSASNITSTAHIIISFIVILPLIIDSYFELRYLLAPPNKKEFITRIKSINILIILEYAITLSYFFIQITNIKLVLDVISALIMALLIVACKKEANKWKTLI